MSHDRDARSISRRVFVGTALTGGASLALGFTILSRVRRNVQRPTSVLAPSLWLRIDEEGLVHIRVHKTEMGQGVLTALPMLLADELGAEWSSVRVEQADADFRFTDQNTSGSSSISDSWLPLRRAGATAREMLVAAAAARWGVAPGECTSAEGAIVHRRSSRRTRFGELVEDASRLTPPDPERVRLRPPDEYRLIGRPTPRIDAADKVNGAQRYGIDLALPGMLYASVTRAPDIGGIIGSVDTASALAIPGVRRVLELPADPPSRLPERVAVIADSTWAALEGRRALRIAWKAGPYATLSSATIDRMLEQAERVTPAVVHDHGNALAAGVRRNPSLIARYRLPYLAHAPMEPLNCTARVVDDDIEIWAPTQFPHRAVQHVSRVLDVPRERVLLHVIPMGGGFGRRVYPDFVVESVQIAREMRLPVKTVWSREDDIRNDFFRPGTCHRLSAVTDGNGFPRAWLHAMTGPSIARQVFGDQLAPADSEIGGAIDLPYGIPSIRIEYHFADIPIPLGVWRSVSQSQNVFVVESFIDELAHRGGHDPLDYRLRLLARQPRLTKVLRVAAERASWGSSLGNGRGRRGRGVAVCTYGPTFVAQVAEVTIDESRRIKVDRMICAVDCGRAINPLGVEAQIESGLVWGLSAALKGRITVKDGGIVQSSFRDYDLLRMSEMPRIDVIVVPSTETPNGVGEPGVSPVAPAVANAVFAATGVRLRDLPLSLSSLPAP